MLVMDDVLHPDAPEKVRFVHPERIRPVGEVHHQDVGRHLGEVHLHQRLDAGLLDGLHLVHRAGRLGVRRPVGVGRHLGEVHHQDVGHHLGEELDAHRHRWRMGCLLHVVHGRLALDLAYPLDVALILGVESQKLLA